jgi:hypothetical protein
MLRASENNKFETSEVTRKNYLSVPTGKNAILGRNSLMFLDDASVYLLSEVVCQT